MASAWRRSAGADRPRTISSISRTVRHTENVAIVRGGRNAARASVVPGWSRTCRSTGLPQRRKRGTSGSRIRATVTATTGSSGSQDPARAGRPGNAASVDQRRRYSRRTCQPATRCRPSGSSARKRSTASSSRHSANTAIRRSCRRSGDTVGAPRRMSARHSAWSRPGVVPADGGRSSALAVAAGGSSARWNVCIIGRAPGSRARILAGSFVDVARRALVTPRMLISQVKDLVRTHYVFPDVASDIADVLDRLAVESTDEPAFAEAATAALRSVNGDRHLRVRHYPDGVPPEKDDEEVRAWFASLAREDGP